MLKKMLKNKFVKIFDIVFLSALTLYTGVRIYLVMISPIVTPYRNGGVATYYNLHSVILSVGFLILVFILANVLFLLITKYKDKECK